MCVCVCVCVCVCLLADWAEGYQLYFLAVFLMAAEQTSALEIKLKPNSLSLPVV